MMLTSAEKQRIGDIGEKALAAILRSEGHNVVMSELKYDHVKDMLVDDLTLEVKTETYFYSFPDPRNRGSVCKAFTVPLPKTVGNTTKNGNQLKKCLEVDRLIFMSRPMRGEGVVNVYEAPPRGERKWYKHTTKDGRDMAGFLVDDMKLLYTIDNKRLVEALGENKVEKSSGYSSSAHSKVYGSRLRSR